MNKTKNADTDKAFYDLVTLGIQLEHRKDKVMAYFKDGKGNEGYVYVVLADYGGDLVKSAAGAVEKAVRKIKEGY